MRPRLIVFSDLDGCLLNKQDYRFEAALPALRRLRAGQIPVVLASSKTLTEMRTVADELGVRGPLISENGGLVCFDPAQPAADCQRLGVDRKTILDSLRSLKKDYRFQSFVDLGVPGIARLTGLPSERASAAAERATTEPLVWEDDETALPSFRAQLEQVGLVLTQGGRFWHVSGPVNKGIAMDHVLSELAETDPPWTTIAVGDSPIDAEMLRRADYPIVIPPPHGPPLQIDHPAVRTAQEAGAVGWGAMIDQCLEELLGSK